MGGEYRGYATDITCSFPISGEFSKDQTIIYEAVNAAQMAVLKVGVRQLGFVVLTQGCTSKKLSRLWESSSQVFSNIFM